LAAENRWHVLVRYIVEKITTPLLPTRNILPNPATG
jgi:hypothetical protein